MSTPLATAADVAERLHITTEQAKRMSKRDGWPCIKFGARTIRYSESNIETIKAMYESGGVPKAADPFGQTSRSRAKSA